MHLILGSQLSHGLFFFEYFLEQLCLELSCILLPCLFLHELFYTLQADEFLSDILGAL
jgi:hypothetical protein